MKIRVFSTLFASALAAALVAAPAYAQHAQHGETVAPPGNHAMPADHATPADHAMSADHAIPADHAGHAIVPGHAMPGDHAAAAHGEGHGEAGEHGGHHALAPINWFDFGNKEQPPFGAMIINFVLLMGMYVYFGKKPIAEALKNRRASVAKEIEEAQRMKHEAEERAAKYQEKLKHLEEELKDTRAALVEAGKGDRDRIVREAEEKAVRMEKDAVFLVEQELKQLRQDLTREAVEIAVAAAEELLKKRVTPVDQERLAEDYLVELAAKTKSTPSIPVPGRAPAPQGGHQ